MTEPMRSDQTACCIAGAGPVGMMLGLLLARQGVEVLVLEKHADFLRDFRGVPSTPRRWSSWPNSAGSTSSCACRTPSWSTSPSPSRAAHSHSPTFAS